MLPRQLRSKGRGAVSHSWFVAESRCNGPSRSAASVTRTVQRPLTPVWMLRSNARTCRGVRCAIARRILDSSSLESQRMQPLSSLVRPMRAAGFFSIFSFCIPTRNAKLKAAYQRFLVAGAHSRPAAVDVSQRTISCLLMSSAARLPKTGRRVSYFSASSRVERSPFSAWECSIASSANCPKVTGSVRKCCNFSALRLLNSVMASLLRPAFSRRRRPEASKY